MKRKMIPIYRKSSPRTGKDYDVKMIDERQLAAYLKRGYFAKLPKKKPKPDPEPKPKPNKEPESDKPKIRSIETIPPSKLSDEIKVKIKRARGTFKKIAGRFNVTPYTVSRIKKGKIK